MEPRWPDQKKERYAGNSFANSRIKSNNYRSGFQVDTYNSKPYSNPSSNNFDTQSLTMYKILNYHDNGLRRSARSRKSGVKEELKNRKSRTIYSTATATKVAFGVFSLFALASSVTIPKH